jgi:hypothetical protein
VSGRNISARMTIGIGKISLNGTGTVTSLSAYLNKYEVAADSLVNEYAVSTVNLTRDIFVDDEPLAGNAQTAQTSALIQGLVLGASSPPERGRAGNAPPGFCGG